MAFPHIERRRLATGHAQRRGIGRQRPVEGQGIVKAALFPLRRIVEARIEHASPVQRREADLRMLGRTGQLMARAEANSVAEVDRREGIMPGRRRQQEQRHAQRGYGQKDKPGA